MPSPRLAAALFDLDGTLVDNMRFHADAWLETAGALGLSVPRERFERELAGLKNEEILPALLGRPLRPEEVARWAGVKEQRYRALFGPHLALLPGAAAFLDRLAAAGIRRAVASSAPAENRAFVLDGLGVRGRFGAVIGAESVRRGKPAPDLFLAAAEALAVTPEACVVFEDAVLGVTAARAAGMMAVGITTVASAAALREAGAAFTAPDFTALPAALLELLA